MSTLKVVVNYTFVGEPCDNTFHFWNESATATPTTLVDAAAAWIADILPYWRAVVVEGVVFNDITVSAYNLAIPYNASLGAVTGDVALGNGDAVAVDLPLNVRRTVGQSIITDTNAPYGGLRPIRRGRFFLSGLPKGFMAGSGFQIWSTLSSEWSDFVASQLVTLDTPGSIEWEPVVLGLPLDALPPSPSFPDGKPARPYLVAPVLNVVPVEFTKLSTRDS